MTILSACVLVYAVVTQGGRMFARLLEAVVNR